jgi:tetratricopeptide (TPR) repeat protein
MTQVETLMWAAAKAAEEQSASPLERAEMLVELAMGLQRRPKTPEHLQAAVRLYEEALALCPAEETLLGARIAARRGTALQAIPEEGSASIEQARAVYEAVIPTLSRLGGAEEVAEAEMNLGLCLQHLVGRGRARITDAIAAYQRALRTFEAKRFPVEFALLQSNLATAFLSMPAADEGGKIREALAVQCFEEALKAVNLVEHPSEYAMLQNNLGNALQCVSSSHAAENHLRALAAYDEALKVRSRATTPVEYANTLANKASCLCTLGELQQARACYQEAQEVFEAHGESEKARIVAELLREQLEAR